MEKMGFIYLWYDRKRKMYYVGCHWGTIDDGYICSSNRMRDAYRRRPQDFKRRILKTNVGRNLLLEEEYKWLSLIDPLLLGIKYYNLSNRYFGHWSTDVNKKSTVGKKISKALLEKNMHYKHSEETKQKISVICLGKKRKPFTEDHKKKMSLARAKRITSNETKQKMSASLKGNIPWNKGKKCKIINRLGN